MIRFLTYKDVKKVAKLHRLLLSGLLSEFGEEFLEKYYRVSLSTPELFTLVYIQNEQVCGVASGASSMRGLYFKIIKRDVTGFTLLILRNLVVHPSLLIKTIMVLGYPGFADDSPELLTLAVLENARKKGIGRKLFFSIDKEFQNRGIKGFKIGVYESLAANGFYRKMGCKILNSFNFLGSRMNYYYYEKDREI